MADLPRVIAIMGSGETAPTMVTTHQELFARLPTGARAVLVETPYGFQENADWNVGRVLTAIERLMGMLLVAISVQMFMDGITSYLRAAG